MTRLALATVFVLAFAFLPVLPAKADCVEDPNGGCLGATPSPSRTPTPTLPGATPTPAPTPRPSILSASVVCNQVTHYNDVTVRITYSGSWELWSSSDDWFARKEVSGIGSATVVFHWSAIFNKADLFLMAPGTRGPDYADSIAGTTVHAVWGAGWNC